MGLLGLISGPGAGEEVIGMDGDVLVVGGPGRAQDLLGAIAWIIQRQACKGKKAEGLASLLIHA